MTRQQWLVYDVVSLAVVSALLVGAVLITLDVWGWL